ncbi:ABC transporter F family member 4-like [Brassica napus]|uniref:ABC transporter F family member 4-like n=1 Tax=Brassica napus TaxID=3708 RepID=UPI002079D511|nr:ABC transporter F family member 4-like [Brassica napus]
MSNVSLEIPNCIATWLKKLTVNLEELLIFSKEDIETEKSKETEAATKTKGKKNGVRPSREVDHQEEDDTEVEHGAKESDTSKVNEEQPQEEEEQEVDVDDGDKESENSETNEDGEVNEDESKKHVKGTKKRGRVPKGMKKGVTTPREVQQQVEDDAEVDVGAKEIENPETNEDGEVNEDASKKPVKGTKKRGRGTKGTKKGVTPPREVQRQVEDDAEVDVGAKEIENPETNEDGEVNEDASKKPVKGTKKRGRGNKGMKKGATPPREVQQQVEDDAEVDVSAKEIENPETTEDGEVNEDASKKPVKGTKKRGRGTKGMKKGVTPPREVQQQVKDDAEVDVKESKNPKTNEDGEVNEDASKKHMKFTKKRERVTKEPNVDTSKPKRQKKQEDSAADAIGRVLEDLKKAD